MPDLTCERGESKVYKISCDPAAPRTGKSAGIEGWGGTVDVRPDRITVTVNSVRINVLYLLSIVMVALSLACIARWAPREGWWAFGLVALSLVVSTAVPYLLLSRKRVFVTDPRQGRAYGMMYPRVTYQTQHKVLSLELPTGKWLAISANDDDDMVALTADLQRIYGDRMAFERGCEEQ